MTQPAGTPAPCPACGASVTPETQACPACGADTWAESPTLHPRDKPTDPNLSSGPTLHSQRGKPDPREGVSASIFLADGAEIGHRYQVTGLLGSGGMGAVYRAHDRELDRDVALKVLRPEIASDPGALERFRREIQLSSRVTHGNVLRVYDLGESDGVRFLTMQCVEGDDLSTLIRREGRLPAPRLLDLFRQICLGLAAAHEQGVIHRDLKPQNIMVDSADHVYVTDFGLAKLQEQQGLTQAGALLGTPSYMSPEQVKGEPLDARSDIYSLGVILYEMATGLVPFSGGSIYEVMMRRLNTPPRPASELNPELPPYLANVLARCMATDLRDRYASLAEVLADLDAARSRPGPVWTVRARRRWLGLAAALLVAAGLGLGGWRLIRTGRPAVVTAPPAKSVLIADFENKTGDPVFDGTLEPALSVALEGASFITSYNRADAYRIGARLQPGATGLGEGLARLVAAREGVSIVTSGTVERRGEGYGISVRAVDAVTGQQIVVAQDEVSGKDGVLTAVSKLAARVRRALGDTTPASAQLAAAETFTAGSLDAAHAYAAAQAFQGDGKWDEAVREYEKAIQLDPNLGRAYAGLAVVQNNRGRRQEAEKYYQFAMARIGRMSDREKFRTRGAYYVITRQPDKAIEQLSALVTQYPADDSGLANLAVAHYLKRDMARALEYGRRAMAIYPKAVPLRNNVGLFAMYAGDFETAIKEQQTCLEMEPDFVAAYVGLALSQLAGGRPDQARATWDKLATVGPAGASQAAQGLADLAIYQGRLADARTTLDRAIEVDLRAKDAEAAALKLTTLADAWLAKGDRPRAVAAADRARSLSLGSNITLLSGLVLAQAGEERRALGLAAELETRIETEPQLYSRLIRGEVALKRKNAREALSHFGEANALSDSWLGRYGLGRAYLVADAFTEAHAEFEACLKRRGEATAVLIDEIPSYRVLPPLHYYLGRAHEGLGSPDAAESYRTFLGIKQGDEDPLVADARRRLAGR